MCSIFQALCRILTLLGCLCFVTIAAETQTDEQKRPCFVANIIAHVPQNFNASLVEKYKKELENIPYYIKPKFRGIVEEPVPLNTQGSGLPVDPILSPFFHKLSTEAFVGSTTYTSEDAAKCYMHVAILLNRMASLDPDRNQALYGMIDDLTYKIPHKILAALWRPQWMKRETGGNRSKSQHHKAVTFEEVAAYYQDLHTTNPELAYAFLEKNEKSVENTIIPYRELRQTLLASEATRALVRSARGNLNRPVYIAFMDADTESFCPEDMGVFTAYQDAITESEQDLHFLTSGYCISSAENAYARMSVSLDLGVRRALGRVLPLAPYYPEPNTIVRVLDDFDTLEGGFCILRARHAKYGSPQEMPQLIGSLVNMRFDGSKITAAQNAQFLSIGALETTMPTRFLENNNGKKSPKKCTKRAFDVQTFTRGVFSELRNTSQSHLKVRDWGQYVYNSFKELERGGSITISQFKASGSIVKNRKDQVLISLFSTMYKGCSPIDRIIREIGRKGYNFYEYCVHVITTYDIEKPVPIEITYGGAASTAPTGRILKKEVTSYSELNRVIDLFYTESVSANVQQAAQQCGLAERDVLIHYYVTTYKPPVQVNLRPLNLKKDPKRLVSSPNDTPQEPLSTQQVPVTQPVTQRDQTMPSYSPDNFRRLLDYLQSHLSKTEITIMAGYSGQYVERNADINFQRMWDMRARNLEWRWNSLLDGIRQEPKINMRDLSNAMHRRQAAA